MNPLITDELVEAAAKALFATEEPDRNAWRWDKPNPQDPAGPLAWHGYWLNAARAALEAAAPIIAAQAWEEGYQACRNRPRVDGYLINRANPYQARADAIERGES